MTGTANDQPDLAWYCCVVAAECALLAFLEKGDRCLTKFQARKMCHAGTGLMLLQFDSRNPQARLVVYIIGCCALAMTWQLIPGIRPFRFGKVRDIGMTVYLLVAMLWFWLRMPILVLAPMFFADPAGAIVGKWLSSLEGKGICNPVWWRGCGTTKTVGGSAAVLVFTALTFAAPATLGQRLVVGAMAALAEALGGAYDNLLLVTVVVGARGLLNELETGQFCLEVGWCGPTVPVPAAQAFLGRLAL